jgi:hypothetical protein
MIKINNGVPAFIATGADTMTSTKTALLSVNYQATLGSKEVDGKSVPQGLIGSWLFNEQGTNVMGVQKIQNDTDPCFEGKDILEVLTEQYIAELKALNPSIEFTNTLVK